MHGYHFECNVDFNPRSREGSDIGAEVTTKDLENFNPRSREGSDYSRHPTSCPFLDFNPRSREGSDFVQLRNIF